VRVSVPDAAHGRALSLLELRGLDPRVDLAPGRLGFYRVCGMLPETERLCMLPAHAEEEVVHELLLLPGTDAATARTCLGGTIPQPPAGYDFCGTPAALAGWSGQPAVHALLGDRTACGPACARTLYHGAGKVRDEDRGRIHFTADTRDDDGTNVLAQSNFVFTVIDFEPAEGGDLP